MLEPKRIIRNGIATIVFWNDGTKTIVKCAEDDEPDDYMAFCAAYCKKVFGSNSHLKRVIKDAENTKVEKPKRKKPCPVFKAPEAVVRDALYYAAISSIEPTGRLSFMPMPGCLDCKSVDTCRDRFTEYAKGCNSYDHGRGFMY